MARKDQRAKKIPENTDVAINGAGPGGYAAAFEAAKLFLGSATDYG